MAPRVSLSDDVLHYVKRVVTACQSRPLAHTEELLSELSSLTTCLTLDTALYRLIEVKCISLILSLLQVYTDFIIIITSCGAVIYILQNLHLPCYPLCC